MKRTNLNQRDDDAARQLEARWLGICADELYQLECKRRGLDPHSCLQAPLTWLSATATLKATKH